MKKQFKEIIVVLLMVLLCLPADAAYAKQNSSSNLVTMTLSKKQKKTGYFYKGGKMQLKVPGTSPGKVKWNSSNKRIATVNKKGRVTAKKVGKTTITGKYKKRVYKFKVIVWSDNEYVRRWAKDWVRQYIDSSYSPFDKVLYAEFFVSNYLSYGTAKGALDVLKKGRGTCVSGNRLLVELLKAMGFSAKLRKAVNDDMSKYPENLIFMSEHHNVKVKINGRYYYVDGTPESGLLYMSSDTEPIYYAYLENGEYVEEINKLPR